jgi:hypothetical protein
LSEKQLHVFVNKKDLYLKIKVSFEIPLSEAGTYVGHNGCQIFIGSIYQNGENFQRTTKIPNDPKK